MSLLSHNYRKTAILTKKKYMDCKLQQQSKGLY